MKDSLFTEFPHERTVFSDENYAAIGRALTYATAFESACRALSSMNHVKSRMRDLTAHGSGEYEDALIQAADEIWDAHLRKHISQLIQYFEFPSDVKQVLRDAKTARNEIAHELTLGAAHWIETDAGRNRLIQRLQSLAVALASGLLVVELLTLITTNEERPSGRYLSEYAQSVAQWIAKIEEMARV